MVSVLLENRNILFLHVPRTSGGSISRALSNEIGAVRYPVVGMVDAIPCAEQLQRHLPRPITDYRTVSVVRNPWDWTVSAFLHVTKNAPGFDDPPSFRNFLFGEWARATILQYPSKFTNPRAFVAYHSQITQQEHLSLNGRRIALDYLCRFEKIHEKLQKAFDGLLKLPHVNRSERIHYSCYYDSETRNLIAERNATLIEEFGYRFDSG